MTSAVQARNLHVLRSGTPALRGVDLEVAPGEFVLVTSPSGGGKSTLLHALGGLLGPVPDARVEGEVRVQGLDVHDAPSQEVARRVGAVFQHAEDQLLSLDVTSEVAFKLHNLGLPPDEVEDRTQAALERFDVEHLAHRDVASLSGGEAKRVALAAATASDPPVLLLDEPLGHLDPAGRRQLVQDLATLPPDTTVVCAEHRVDPLRSLTDRVVHLREGRQVPPTAPRNRPSDPHHRFPHPPGTKGDLHLHRVTAGPGSHAVLQDVSLELAGGLVAVAGPNGAGKTTLLRVVAGLLEPTEGRVTRSGEDLSQLPPPARARHVGYVPQDPTTIFLEGSVREELRVGPRNLDVPLDLEHHARRHGLRALLDRHPHALSGGERERSAWAAAHAHEPPVQCYDEPTTGLDEDARRVLHQRLARVRRRGLALVATHDPALLQAADRVLLLHDGHVALDGAPDEVLARERLAKLGGPRLEPFALEVPHP